MQSEMEQMYLLEIIVEDVDVIEEGILDRLRDQVAIADHQMKQRSAAVKDAPAKDKDQINDGADSVENKEAADPNSNPITNPTSESAQPSRPEKAQYSKLKLDRNAPVNVIAQFLDFPALKIKMNEFEKYTEQTPSPSAKDKRHSQQGKSCLFSMLPKDMIDAIRKHPIVIQVLRESSKDEPAHLIGIGRICLGQEFIDTVALGNTPTIAVTTVQGDYDVANIFGDVTATVSAAIRLSCVGPSITTQFTYNQFDGNFKFSSSDSTLKSDAAKSKLEYRTGQKEAFFHKDDSLGIFDGPPPECKLPSSTIPWKKLHEELVDSRTCGSKRLFREQARRCYVDDTFDCTPSFAGCCGGSSRMCDDFVPHEFGTCLPPEIKKSLPTANEYEVPFDGQLTGVNVNWRNPPKQVVSQTMTGVCCGMTDGHPGLTSGCPCVSKSPPVNVCSNTKVNLAPPLEDAGPHLKGSPTDKPGTSSFKRDLQYVPCPNAPDALNAGNVSCGLEELLNQQNLKNLLQPSLMAPACPPDSSGRRPSLCTCPKVPTVAPKPVPGGVVRCECTNILTALKPIELPYTCSKQPEQQVHEVPTCPPCPPVPIRLPPPAPECPLSKLLKESQEENMPQQNTPTQIQGVTPQGTPLPPKCSADSRALAQDTPKPTIRGSDSPPKSDPLLDHSTENTFSKSKKSHKVLQDEVTRATTASSYYSEPQLGNTKTHTIKTQSKSASPTSSIASVPPKKKKKRQIVDDSGRTPTQMMEPPKELNIAYTPTAGLYPANTIGHRNCIPVIPLVPKRMGWLWNIKDAEGFLKPGKGWRPGSIQGNVMKVMDNIKTSSGKTSSLSKSRPMIAKTKSGEQHTRKIESSRQMMSRDGEAPLVVPYETFPTLHVHKKHGLHYVSMIPPPKDPAQNRHQIKRMNSRGDMVDESYSDDSHPVQFRIDTKHRDTLVGGSDLYETDDTSTVSEDSYQMEVVAPSTLRHRQPQPVKINMEVQVSENDFIKTAAESKVDEAKGEQKKEGKQGKKKSSAASRKGKKGKKVR